MIIYNLFPLLAGPFSQWAPHLKRAAHLGFDWVFINPIQRSGSSGSLYSVDDYYALDGRMVDSTRRMSPDDQLREVIETAKSLNMQMMIDLVANHCSVDSNLLRAHPAWFVWERPGIVANPFCIDNGQKVIWKDLAKFDHRESTDKEGLYRYFRDVVEHCVALGFRGFRCDAAYQVPRAFWRRLIQDVKSSHPDVVFLAETLGCPPDQTRMTASAGFDYVFNSSKWWDFQGSWLLEQYHLTREIAPSVSFPESHDTPRLFEEVQGNVAAVKQRYLFASFFSAAVMMPMGFEYGFRKRLHVVNTSPSDWEKPNVDLCSFISEVNAIKAGHPVFLEDAPTQSISTSQPNVLVLWKGSARGHEEALLLLNKDVHRRHTFSAGDLHEFVQAGAPLQNLSPDNPFEYIPSPFSYELRPGEGLILVTARDASPDD